MAIPGQEELIRDGVANWNKWREEEPNMHISLEHASLEHKILSKANLKEANLFGAKLKAADLSYANLERADLSGADLTGANLSGADLRFAKLSHAKLERASLINAQVNPNTNFKDLRSYEGCFIDRFTLSSLSDDYSGLTRGHRIKMRIIDDVATLQASFSGFYKLVHLAGSIIFVFPYVWFLLKLWAKAKFFPPAVDDPSITIGIATLRYIYNGGIGWEAGFNLHWSCFIFLSLLAFNVLRWYLIYMTAKLELQQSISNLPARFSFAQRPISVPIRKLNYLNDFLPTWGHILSFYKFALAVATALIALNSYHFFTQKVSI